MNRLVGIALGLAGLTHEAAAACRLDKGPQHTVARIVDGETVELDDATRVRLIGILGPRARDVGIADDRWPSEAAARVALEALVIGRSVQLWFDTTRRDRHGHWLAHLVRTDDTDGQSVQNQLLAAGHARVDAVDGQRRCVDDLLAAEDRARADARGLWTEPAYRVRDAVPARDIVAYIGTFQIITGVVASIETGRGVSRLILGADRRRDLAVSIRNTDRNTAGALGGDVKALVGQPVEVRGWLIRRAAGGPEIDASLGGHVRLLDTAPLLDTPSRAPSR